MKKYIIIISLLVGIKEIALAQGKIYGNIVNNGKPLEFATVTLSNYQDSSKVLFYEASDSLGQFSFNNLAFGKYKLNLKLVGYLTFSKNVTLSSDSKEYQLKDLNIEENKSELGNVIVVAQKKMIEKIIFILQIKQFMILMLHIYDTIVAPPIWLQNY